MKNRLGKVVAKAAVISAKAASKSTSMVGFYQPVVPKQLKAGKKSEKE
jgi:cyclic lactone autoinducer peptide